MRAVVVAAGDLHPADAAVIAEADLVLAADGGATALDRLGRRPDVLVGDLDSVAPELVDELERAGTRVERHPADKDASDTELAVDAARAAGATEVLLVGATGGERLDHEVANLLLVADANAATWLSAAHGAARMRAIRGAVTHRLDGRRDDLVTLLALDGQASGISTRGLRWPLANATLVRGRSRGLSNVISDPPAFVDVTEGTLLVIETPMRADQ